MVTDGTVTKGVWEHANVLMADSHLREQVGRLMEPMRLIMGTRDCPPEEEVLKDVAMKVALLEANPDVSHLPGLVVVTRGVGYSLSLRAAEVHPMKFLLSDLKDTT